MAEVYLRLIGARIRANLQYRASFVMFTVSQFVITFLDFVAIALVLRQVPQLAGWTLTEVAFLYGLAGVGFGLSDVFVSQVERLRLWIQNGKFDRVLTRPLGALFQMSVDEFELRRIGKVLQAAVVLAVALVRLDVDWTVGRIAMVPVTVASGFLIFSAIWVIGSTICFWTVDSYEVVNSFTYGGNFAAQYPVSIYARWLRRLLVFVVPMAFVGYLPALYVLEKDDPLRLPELLRFASPVVAVGMVVLARAVWLFGIRHYRSTGS